MTTCKCSEYEAAFGALLSGEATADDMKRANEHLAACETCAKTMAELGVFKRKLTSAYANDANGATFQKTRGMRLKVGYGALALAASLAITVSVLMMNKSSLDVAVAPRAVVMSSSEAVSVPAEVSADASWAELDEEEEALMLEFMSDDLLGTDVSEYGGNENSGSQEV